MSLELPALRPRVRAIVVTDVAEQQAGVGAVHDQPDVGVHPDRPEALVLRLVQPVKAQTRGRRVHLKIERGRLHGLLLVAGESGEAVGERIGDQERVQSSSSLTT